MITSNGHADAVIRVRDVSVSFGLKRVLENINLDVYQGEVLVLLGGSGSGKTTLLRQILGLMKPDTGNILIHGVDITSCTPVELDAVRRKMGAAFQAAALFNSLSIEANVALPLQELTTLADSTIKLIVWMTLWAVGLAEAAGLYPNELSGGMRKRAAIARAIALDPEILVFDEPSAGLDPIVSAGLDKLILFLKETFGITILVVTHALESAFRIADRLAMLYEGHLVALDAKEEFLKNTNPRLRQFLEGRADPAPGGEQRFMVSYLREFLDEY
jgi:phospholipid/cholesterol/gamma-HCH transport system ATP-binding protein